MSRQPISYPLFAKRIALVFLLPFLLVPSVTRAQDAVRPSLAGEASSEARRQDIERIPYNLLVGPIRFRIGASIGVEYNDNINYADSGFEEEDVIIRPQINFDAIWPVTQLNTLRLDIGISYAAYIDHSDANTNGILIAPGSQLAFDIFVGDFRINIHDRFSVQQDPIAELGLSNVTDYGRFQNYAGISILWDLNKILVTLGYDHYNYISTTNRFDYLDRSAEQLSGTIGFNVTETMIIGVEGNAVFTTYDKSVLNDSKTYSAGGFFETQLSSNLRVRLAGGYQWIDFDHNFLVFNFGPPFGLVTLPDKKDQADYYANGLLTHQINASISQSISAGHESQLGVNSNSIRINYVRHTVTWKVLRNTLLSTEAFYEDAKDSGGFAAFPFSAKGEHLQRYGGALTVGYQLTPHVTLGLRYQYTQKDSDVPLRDYKQNRVSLDGTYSF
ncbi:MAG: outer membrane beta-barrel protein [Verrucomicrobiota bacterium]